MKYLLLLTLVIGLGGCAASPAPQANADIDVQAKLERGDRALREARLTDAEIIYRELTAQHPTLPEVWLRLGNVYTRQAQLEAAIRVYEDGLRYDRDDGRIWYNLAVARLKQALQTLETSSSVLPEDSPYRERINRLHNSLLSRTTAAAADPDPEL